MEKCDKPTTDRMQSHVIRVGAFTSWENGAEEANSFATRIGRERVVSISHSGEAGGEGVIIVWYWR